MARFLFYFQNFNALVINPFQWLISANCKSDKTFDVILCTKSVFFIYIGCWGLQSGSCPSPHRMSQ